MLKELLKKKTQHFKKGQDKINQLSLFTKTVHDALKF